MLLLSTPKAPGGMTFATGQDGSFTEVLDASWESTRYAWNANARWRALEDAYDSRIKAVSEATGQTLDNPLRAIPTADDYREIARRTKASGKALYLPDYMDEKFQRQLARIAEGAPDKLGVLRPHVPTVQDAVDLAQGAERKLSDVLSRTSGLTGTLANLAGGVGASFEDPATYVLAPIGLTGSASKSLLWNALRAAATNAGAQATMEPFIQQWRAEAGLEAGLVPALKDIGLAGAVGGGLDVLFRGTVRGFKAGRGTGAPAPAPIERGATIEEAIPRLSDDNPIKQAAAGDDAALVTAAQKIETHLTPTERGALRALEDETGLKIDTGEDLAAIAQAIRHAEDPLNEPPVLRHKDEVKGPITAPGGEADVTIYRGQPASRASLLDFSRPNDQFGIHFGTKGQAERFGENGGRVGQFKLKAKSVLHIKSREASYSTNPENISRYILEQADDLKLSPDDRAVLARLAADDAPMVKNEMDYSVKSKQLKEWIEAKGWDAISYDNISAEGAGRSYLLWKPNVIDQDAWRLAEGLGSEIETATVLRARPELANGLPAEGKVRTALSLSRLSGEGFEFVANSKTVKPQWGALVGDLVADQAEHMPMLQRISEVQPETAEDVRRLIAEATARPTSSRAIVEHLGGGDPTPAESALQSLAAAIQSGTVPAKRAREALKRRIESGAIETEAGPQPAPRGLDEPAGVEAKAQVEEKLKERKSRLGKGLKDITAEQKGGQAAVDRVAGRGGAPKKPPQFALSPAAAAAMPDVRVKLNEIAATLPKAVRIRLYDRLTFNDLPTHIQRTAPPGVEAKSIQGIWDPEQMVIHLALSTADPVATLRHEQMHMMRALGLLSDDDYRRLVRHAEKTGARKAYKIDATYGATIKAQHADKIAREAVLVEETVAHLVADRLTGKTIGGGLDKVLKPIRDFLRLLRDALGLKGLRTVQDVFAEIERGGGTGTAAKGSTMFSLSPDDAEAALGVRLGEAELRGKVGAAARKLAGNVEMQAAWIEGMGLEAGDAEEIVKLYHGFLKDFRARMDESTAKRLALNEVADLLETEALHRKRVALLQLEAATRARMVLTTHKNARGEVDPVEAMIGLLEHQGLEGTPIESSVAGKQKAILGMAQAQMDELLWTFRKRGSVGRMNLPKMEAVVREAFGEGTGDVSAKELAKAWAETAEGLRQRFNQAGGAVGKLEKWGLPQAHDGQALRKRGFDAWRGDILPLLAPEKMRHPLTGAPMTRAQVAESLRVIFDRIVTDGAVDAPMTPQTGGSGALHKQHAEHRFLVFKDADAWLNYQKAYGAGGAEGIFATMMNHLNLMARDIAAMEVLGPNPNLTVEAMIGFVRQQTDLAVGGKPALFPTKSPIGLPSWRPEDYGARNIEKAREMWSLINGSANVPVNGLLGNTMSAIRNITFGTVLGSAMLSSLTDIGRQQVTRRFAGLYKSAHTGRDLRGVHNPFVVLGDVVQQFKNENRREALAAGLIMESAVNVMHGQARYVGSLDGPAWTRRYADRMLTWSGLTPWTQAGRHSFGLTAMKNFADDVGKRFADLDPERQMGMKRYGLGEAEWDEIRQFTPSIMGDADTFLRGREPVSGLDPKDRRRGRTAGQALAGKDATPDLDPIRYLKPTDIKNRRLAERYLEMILQETERAVPSGTVANRAFWVGSNKPGSGKGELLRTVSMLKAYGAIVMVQDLGRISAEVAAGRKLRGARYAASILTSMTIYGALVVQLKSLSRGEDPRPMDDEKFWGAALLQGGGLGIFGDYLFGQVNRHGGGWGDAALGPVASRANNIWNLTAGNLIQFGQDEPTNLGREAVNFFRLNVSAPFYARLAYERVLLDEMQKVADPEARKAFRRKASKLKTQFKTGYWWAPGETGPRRAPSFANALGK